MIGRSQVRSHRLQILGEEDENVILLLDNCYQPALEQGNELPSAAVSQLSGQKLDTVLVLATHRGNKGNNWMWKHGSAALYEMFILAHMYTKPVLLLIWSILHWIKFCLHQSCFLMYRFVKEVYGGWHGQMHDNDPNHFHLKKCAKGSETTVV